MPYFEVYNNLGEKIIGDGIQNIGQVATENVVLKSTWYSNNILEPPAFIDKYFGVPVFNIVGDKPVGIFKFAEGACACGGEYYSPDAGTMHWLQENYPKESGYLDVYDAQGNLTWSAKSAAKVPRVTQVINLTADQVRDGTRVYIGNQLVMMNNMPSIMRPGPVGALTVGGMYMRYEAGYLDIQFKVKTNNSVNNYIESAYRQYGFNIYLYSYGV